MFKLIELYTPKGGVVLVYVNFLYLSLLLNLFPTSLHSISQEGRCHLKQLRALIEYVFSLVTKSCPTLHDPMDCSPSGSSVHGISQAKLLEWVAIF